MHGSRNKAAVDGSRIQMGIPRIGVYDAVERSLILLEKFDAVLRTARKPLMDKSRSPYQDVVPLIRLRNALVHFKPETQWSDEVHYLRAIVNSCGSRSPSMCALTRGWSLVAR